MKHLTNLDLNKNQLLNPSFQKLASHPSSPVVGQFYYNTTDDNAYYWDGSSWITMNGLGATMTGADIVTALNGSTSIIDDDNLSSGVNGAITDKHNHSNKALLDTYNQTNADISSAIGNNHSHSNKALLDTYTQTEVDLADAVSKKHSHTNSTVLANTTASYTTAEETKLSGISEGANNYVHPTTDGSKHVPANGTSNNGKVLTASGTAGTYTWETPLSSVAWGDITDGPSSTPAQVDTTVGNNHSQNTDTGTTATSFGIDTGGTGFKIKNASGEAQVRNAGDTDYADIRVKNLYVEGTTTSIDSNEVNIGDSEILLNSDITTAGANSDGGIAVKRLDADNSTRRDAILKFDETDDKWKAVWGTHTSAVRTNTIGMKYSTAIGNGSSTSIVVTHNLNSRDVVVTLRETASPYAVVMADIEMTSLDTLTIDFATAPTSSQYTVTVIG